jgi:hypothetical protein
MILPVICIISSQACCLFSLQVKKNHGSHEFILEFGTITNSLFLTWHGQDLDNGLGLDRGKPRVMEGQTHTTVEKKVLSVDKGSYTTIVEVLNGGKGLHSLSDNSTLRDSPSYYLTAVCSVLVTHGPSQNPMVYEQYVYPEMNCWTQKFWTNCHKFNPTHT